MSRPTAKHSALSAALLVTLCFLPNCGTFGQQERSQPGPAASAASSDIVYQLGGNTPRVIQPLDVPLKDAEEAKFVQITVAAVQNPQKEPLTLEVHYQPTSDQKIFLGSFSLFPADNPGTFIVPTQGKLRNQGAIVLSIAPIDHTDTTAVRIGVKKFQLRKQ